MQQSAGIGIEEINAPGVGICAARFTAKLGKPIPNGRLCRLPVQSNNARLNGALSEPLRLVLWLPALSLSYGLRSNASLQKAEATRLLCK